MKTKFQFDVSVIIVNYNSIDILDNCLHSLISFSEGFSYEIIVVDNATKSENVKNITDKYPQVKLILNETNRGFAAANNQGIRCAKGEYILILNNDTIFTENSILLVLSYCKSLPYKTFIGCKLLNSDGTHQVSVVEFDNIKNAVTENLFLYKLFPKSGSFNKYYQNYLQPANPIEVDVVKGAFILCPSESLNELKGFDENFFFFSEETDLCLRFKKMGGIVIYYPGTSIIHLGGATTDKMPWFSYKNKCIAKIKFYQKHYSGIYFFILVFIHYIGLLLRIPLYFLFGLFTFRKDQFVKSFFYIKQLFLYPTKG